MFRRTIAIRRFRLQLLPLAITAIVIATVVPIEWRPAVWWDGGFDALDFIENLLLYAPLGIALSRCRWWTVIVLVSALSVAAEAMQVWSFERFSSPYDVLSNALGALIGAWAWRRFGLKRTVNTDVVVNGLWLTAALVVAVTLLVIWKLPARSPALSDWNTDFVLLLGNESTGDRPWSGIIHELTILHGALSADDVRALGGHPDDVSATLGPETLYHSSTPVVLNGGAAFRLPQSLSARLVQAVTADGAFTIIARVAVADLHQKGPARIVSFSGDTLHRNFDLGQEQDRITFRVRTAVSGVNGEDFRAETVPVLKPGAETWIVASYDGAVSRIFVDGSAYARSNLAAAGCVVRSMCGSAVPIGWSVLGAAFAMVLLAFVPWHGRAPIMIAAMLAGGIALALPQILHLVPAHVLKHSWMQYMAFVGAATIGIARIGTSSPGDSGLQNCRRGSTSTTRAQHH